MLQTARHRRGILDHVQTLAIHAVRATMVIHYRSGYRATTHFRCAAVLNVRGAVMLCYDVLTLNSLRRWKNSDKASSKHL